MIWKLYLLESFESIENSTSTCVFYFQPDIEKKCNQKDKNEVWIQSGDRFLIYFIF